MAVIIYNSKAGHTYEYALMLSKKLDLPLYSLSEASLNVNSSQEVIFMSWVLGNKVVKLDKMKKYNIIAVCAVGMIPNDTDTILQNNKIKCPLFKLVGGFEVKRLKGVYKLIGKMVVNNVDDPELTGLYGNKVDENNLIEIIQWYERSKNDI